MIVPEVFPVSSGDLLSSLVARPSHPAPPPLQVDTVRVVLAGTVLWAIALVVLLLLGLGLMRWQGQTGPRSGQSERTSNSEVS